MMFSFEPADGYEARLKHYRHSSTLYSSVGAAFGRLSDRPFAGGDANEDPELRPVTAECRKTAPTRPETALASCGSGRRLWSFSPTHFRWIAGSAVTTLPLARYLTDPGTSRYFAGSALLLPVWDLPGVFRTNPGPGVNGSVWSLPIEVAAYVGLALLGPLLVVRGRRRLVL